MTNADLIVQRLREAGVRWVFGIPSGPVLPLIEALRRSDVEFVLTASETSAGFMASVVGHLTGTPGACVATLGPGTTNLATGVGAAWLDRYPVVAITCNVATQWLDRRTQMRIDHQALFAPISKASFALRTESLEDQLAQALTVALAEPPGPVHVDLPEDVARAETPSPQPSPAKGEGVIASPFAGEAGPALGGPGRGGTSDIINEIAKHLQAAQRPIVVTGLTFTRSQARGQLLEFIERQGLPFVSTLQGKGFLPENHPNWCGVMDRARRSDVAAFLNRSDLVLAVGFDPIEINYEEWIGDRPLIHLSTEPAEVSRDVHLVLDASAQAGQAGPGAGVGNLLPGPLSGVGPADRFLAAGRAHMDDVIRGLAALPPIPNAWKAEDFASHRRALAAALRPSAATFSAHQVVDLVREKLPPDGILACDIGAHTHQIGTQWHTDEPWTCLTTNGWSSMGFGMPAAYAAKLVHQDRSVLAMIGDGGFQMTVGELALARRLNLAVPVVVLNDGWLGLMKVKQEHGSYPLHGVHLGDPVESPSHYFGVPCRPARNLDELSDALDWAMGLGGPSVIEAFIDVAPYSQTVFD